MAYKPFKPNRGNPYFNYANSGSGKRESKYEIARMKLFGFRSGIAWKMIPALFYYVYAALYIGSSVLGEFREFSFETADVVMCVLKYIFIGIIAFSPAIFLSDFKYRDSLPLFRKKTFAGNTMGLLVVAATCIFMIWTYQYCMSDTYKESADAYYQEMESIRQEKLEQQKIEQQDTTGTGSQEEATKQ